MDFLISIFFIALIATTVFIMSNAIFFLQMINPISIIGPLIGALVGVFLGFMINNDHKKRLDRERRLFFIKLLIEEMDQLIKFMENNDREYIPLPIDGWNSLINSGDITLFTDLATDLNKVYSEIQRYNYKVIRIRDAIEEESTGEALALTEMDFPKRSGTLKLNLKDTSVDKLFEGLIEIKKKLGNALRNDLEH